MSDIDKEILYWIEYFDYDWIDSGKLIDYIKENFVKTKKEVVIEFIELMELKINDIHILDWDYICEHDNDYVEIIPGKFLNVFLLEDADLELKRNGLVRC